MEDFTTYTETDPTSKITITSTKVDWAALSSGTSARVLVDKGASFFDGDFEIHWEGFLNTTTTDGSGGNAIAVANINNLSVANNTDDQLRVRFQDEGNARFNLQEGNGGSMVQDFDGLTLSTLYYCKFVRDESVGSFGTLYNYVYSDSGRTTLVATQTLTLRGFVDFRYLYAMSGQESGTDSLTGYVQNFDIISGGGGGAAVVPSMATLGVGA